MARACEDSELLSVEVFFEAISQRTLNEAQIAAEIQRGQECRTEARRRSITTGFWRRR